MQNDWEILDDYEWVRYWFVWLRIFNNFVNMVIWTFWTLSFFYTLWLFFFTKEMHFLSYYVFMYMMIVNVLGLMFLDEYLYVSAERKREEERRIRINKIRWDHHVHSVKVRTEKFIDKLRLYPSIKEFVIASKRKFHPIQMMALLERERIKVVKQRLRELRKKEALEREKKAKMREVQEEIEIEENL